MKHKYLEDMGIKLENTPYGWCSNDDREVYWNKEREEYGFDNRETWSLDCTFFYWLYERLMMFNEKNHIDTNFHKFKVNGEELTQQECINKMITGCKYYFKYNEKSSDGEVTFILGREIIDIWKECIFSMWW